MREAGGHALALGVAVEAFAAKLGGALGDLDEQAACLAADVGRLTFASDIEHASGQGTGQG